jgi:hypothetical protein
MFVCSLQVLELNPATILPLEIVQVLAGAFIGLAKHSGALHSIRERKMTWSFW